MEYKKMDEDICLRMKDGKLLIARKGKPFFPEPLHKDVMIIPPNQEGFLVGSYPKHNTIILPLSQYHKMLIELKNNCPNAKKWRVTAYVLIGMFMIMVVIYLQQTIFARNIFRYMSLIKKQE